MFYGLFCSCYSCMALPSSLMKRRSRRLTCGDLAKYTFLPCAILPCTGGAASSLPAIRRHTGNEDVAPPVRLNPAQSSMQMVWLNPARSSESKFQEIIVPRVIRVSHVPPHHWQSAKHKGFPLRHRRLASLTERACARKAPPLVRARTRTRY